jgi:hypothetical protein
MTRTFAETVVVRIPQFAALVIVVFMRIRVGSGGRARILLDACAG